jgi:hypothetical protein
MNRDSSGQTDISNFLAHESIKVESDNLLFP